MLDITAVVAPNRRFVEIELVEESTTIKVLLTAAEVDELTKEIRAAQEQLR